MPPTTILLVDDHAVMRMGLVSLLRTCPALAATGEAGGGERMVVTFGEDKLTIECESTLAISGGIADRGFETYTLNA